MVELKLTGVQEMGRKFCECNQGRLPCECRDVIGEVIAEVGRPAVSPAVSEHAMLESVPALRAAIAQRDARIEELEAQVGSGTRSNKYRAELYDEVWQAARDMGFGNVTEALRELAALKSRPAGGVVMPEQDAPDRDGLVAAVCVLRSQGLGNLAGAVSDALNVLESLNSSPVSAGVALSSTRSGRVYIAGPMTGYENYNFAAFNAEADRLRAQGLHVENPADHGVVDGADWADYLRYDIGRLAGCERIHLLPGWSKSKGAALEVHVAKALGMHIWYAEGAETVSAGAVDERAAFEAFDYSDRCFRLRREGDRYVYATTERELIAFRAGAEWQARAALNAGSAVPDGWVMAPVEPTTEMVQAALDKPCFDPLGAPLPWSHITRTSYAAMLAATPTAKKEG